jgi:hypothetical protein
VSAYCPHGTQHLQHPKRFMLAAFHSFRCCCCCCCSAVSWLRTSAVLEVVLPFAHVARLVRVTLRADTLPHTGNPFA